MDTSLKSEDLLREALALPPDVRSRLAFRLIESLDDPDDLSPEWQSEIQRRIEAIRNGSSRTFAHEAVMDDARKALASISLR